MIVRNVTISLEESLARWLRVRAAERDLSVSRFIAELLRDRQEQERRYESAMQRSLARRPRRISSGGGYPAREELHDRTRVRR